MSDDLDPRSVAVGVVSVPFLMAFLCAVYVVEGVCVKILWGWYAVPLFHLPAISIPQAIGVNLITTLLSARGLPAKETAKYAWVTVFTSPIFILTVGWIVRLFL